MATSIGYYAPTPDWAAEANANARAGKPLFPAAFLEKVAELPGKLPSGCSIVGSYAPRGGGPVLSQAGLPAVMIVETSDDADLTFISNYYSGWLAFNWAPATVVGATREQRAAFVAETQAGQP